MKIKIPESANKIINTLQLNGYEAYIVGGCVRDSLLNIEPKDWDICTSASPETIIDIFFDNDIIKTGIKHGTITILENGQAYEVTTFRSDGQYSDNRRPDNVKFINNITEDLARRDFTINAMAYNDDVGLVDIYCGITSLNNKIIKCVGDAHKRFNEDALRILRALRFSSVYGFSIEQKTSEAIHKNAKLINNIAPERISKELLELLLGKNVLNILLDYNDVISVIIPEIKKCIGFEQNNRFHQYTVYEHIAHAVENYQGNNSCVKLALLLHDIGKPLCYTEDKTGGHFYGHPDISHSIAKDVVDRLKLDNKTKQEVLTLVLYHDTIIEPTPKTIKKWLNKLGQETFFNLLDIRMADIKAHAEESQIERMKKTIKNRELAESILMEQQCFSIKDMQINGKDIIELGIPEGKEIGIILKDLLNMVIAGEIENDRDKLINHIKLITKNRLI